MKKNLVKSKKRKPSFSLKEKIIMLVCCVAITGSGVTVATYAAMTWNASTYTNSGSVSSYGRPPEPVKLKTCGNGKVDPGEQCDGKDVIDNNPNYPAATSYCVDSLGIKKSVVSAEERAEINGMINRGPYTLKCKSNCTVDTSKCLRNNNQPPANTCGNGWTEAGEQCDGNNGYYSFTQPTFRPFDPYQSYTTVTCKHFGYNSGVLKCTKNCTYDISSCYNIGVPPIDSQAPASTK
jgi:hypothetical protein